MRTWNRPWSVGKTASPAFQLNYPAQQFLIYTNVTTRWKGGPSVSTADALFSFPDPKPL